MQSRLLHPVVITYRAASMSIMASGSTKSHGLSKSARSGIIAAVVIIVGLFLLLIVWFLWRNRKLKYTESLADANAEEGIRSWPTKWPTRKTAGADASSRNATYRHGEAVELAPPSYDVAQPLPTYEPPQSNQGRPESYELATMPRGHETIRQGV
ncbi:hypothetical protein D6C86_04769 [Aureobasidium pullulans]|nr:hypothetical protein D6D23_04347 [Aureobasidium pullulans]THW58438.1 hypothetical protein D6D20_07217 [Aureobasidium pullulans]THX07645.1 hypothetical protein D6D18_02243 [Aureobasidium pullulans]THX42261.1 hypothetical protein D6D10_02078 [Aureobasidium pullulans]THY56919.1 hypothetical protein D6C97_04942 [Aureobasidium pullulans]